MLTLGLIVEETVNLGGGTVVGADGETVISSVEDQVLAHDGQTDETEIGTGKRTRRSADIDAGETGAEVSWKLFPFNKKKHRNRIQKAASPPNPTYRFHANHVTSFVGKTVVVHDAQPAPTQLEQQLSLQLEHQHLAHFTSR